MKKNYFCLLFFLFPAFLMVAAQCPIPSVSGLVSYDNVQQTPLRQTKIYLSSIQSQTVVDSAITDNSGMYKICNIPDGIYKLTTKTPYEWGGINAIDAQITAKHFVSLLTLYGLKLDAADVVKNYYVNTTDAFSIQKRFAHSISHFTGSDWIFEEPELIVYSNSPMVINIKGICAGDVNGSYMPSLQSFMNCGDTLIDQRDYQKYPTVKIGSQCWMKKDLNIGTMLTSYITPDTINSQSSNNGVIEKYCLQNNPSNCAIYGGLYEWNEMMQYDTNPGIRGICPTGWHIPTFSEWCLLVSYLDSTAICIPGISYGLVSTTAGGKLKEVGTMYWKFPNTGATNFSGFTAIGSGNRTEFGAFLPFNGGAPFWTSSSCTPSTAYNWGLSYANTNVIYTAISKIAYGCPVRCIKD